MDARKFIGTLTALVVLSAAISLAPPLKRGVGGDLSEANPTLLAQTEFACRPQCVAAAAGQIYLAGDGLLLVVDASATGSPRIIGTCSTGSQDPQGLVVLAGYGYLSDRRGLSIFDLSDPQRPRQVGFCSLQGAGKLVVKGKYAYVCGLSGGKWGLHIVDISDPQNPKITSHRDNLPAAPAQYCLTSDDRYVYLGARHDLWILNVSDPANPKELLHQTNRENLTALNIVEDNLCLADVRNGRNLIILLRLTNPANPEEVGSLDMQESTPHCMTPYGNYLFMLGSGRDFYAVNTAPANHPLIKGRFHLPVGSNHCMAVNGNHVYVCDPDFGLWIFDLSNPSTPILEKSWNLPDKIGAVFVSGKVGCTTGKDLRVLDLSDPTAPREVGAIAAGTPGQEVRAAFGNNAVYASSGSMITVVDVSALTHPVVANKLNIGASIRQISVAGRTAVAACDDGLRVMDVTQLLSPIPESRLGSPELHGCSSVALTEDYACAVEPGVGLKLVNVFRHKKPALAGTLALPGAAAVALKDDWAYVLIDSGLVVVNIADVRKPAVAGRVELPGKFQTVIVGQDHLLLSGPESGLRIYDLTDPAAPRLTGTIPSTSNILGATAQGNYIYTAEGGWMGVYQMANDK